MMSPDDNGPQEQFAAVPSSMFGDEDEDFQQPPPDADVRTVQAASSVGLGGWATGAGSALFAVTKVCDSYGQCSSMLCVRC